MQISAVVTRGYHNSVLFFLFQTTPSIQNTIKSNSWASESRLLVHVTLRIPSEFKKDKYTTSYRISSILFALSHYSDIGISTMASQITRVSNVCSTVCSGADKKKTSKLRVTGLCEENVFIWWRHNVTYYVTRRRYFYCAVLVFIWYLAFKPMYFSSLISADMPTHIRTTWHYLNNKWL